MGLRQAKEMICLGGWVGIGFSVEEVSRLRSKELRN